jgi:hypothetical protein
LKLNTQEAELKKALKVAEAALDKLAYNKYSCPEKFCPLI